MSEYPYIPLTEEETYRMSGLGDVWDRAEAGEPIYALIRDRLRAAEAKMRPVVDAAVEEAFTHGTGTVGGLAQLMEPKP